MLDGTVSGLGLDNRQGNFATNLPLAGATVEVYATDADDRRAPRRRPRTARRSAPTAAGGRSSPTARRATSSSIAAPGYATTHVYRSPFPRSSSVVSLHPERLADADRDAKSLVTLTRPRGYFGVPRDRIALDGTSPPAGIPRGVAGVSTAQLKVGRRRAERAIVGEFNDERIVGRTWPVADNHVVVLELTY